MMNNFEKYAHLYENLYTLEAWFIWLSLWIQYIGYNIALLLGLLLILSLCFLPFMIFFGLINKIKIKIVKKKNKEKLVDKMKQEYKDTLDKFHKKTKKKKSK